MRHAALLLAAGALAGCQALAPPAEGDAPRAPVTEAAATPGWATGDTTAEALVAYVARLREMSPAQVAAEAARQRQGAPRADDAGRVRAAMALVLAHHPEEADILALVEPVARNDDADPAARAMASFLQVTLNDRRRLKESAAAAAARLRDERRTQEQLKQRADAAQERAAQLQQKLDALTEIEKSLSDRQVPSR